MCHYYKVSWPLYYTTQHTYLFIPRSPSYFPKSYTSRHPRFSLKSRAAARCRRDGHCFPLKTARDRLEAEVTDPVDYIKEQKWGGEENPGVGIQLADFDVNPSFSPAAFFAFLVAAEEASAVFAVQALVQAVVLIVVPEEGVSHGHHRPSDVSHVERWVGLE